MSANTYIGDLSEQGLKVRRFQPGGYISLQFPTKGLVWPQLNVGFGRIVEQVDGDPFPNLPDISPNSFVETSIFHTELQVNIRFFKRSFLQPYIGLGGGILFYQPKDEKGNFLGENPFTRQEGETYATATAYLPLTAGILSKLSERISLGLSYTYRPTASDYLDNIGQLGNRKGNDALHSAQLSLYFNMGPVKAPKPLYRPSLLQPMLVKTQVNEDKSSEVQLVEANWLAWEETALLLRKFVYYPVKPEDDLQRLCERFHLRPEVVRQINFMNNDYLAEGMLLRLPDVGQRVE